MCLAKASPQSVHLLPSRASIFLRKLEFFSSRSEKCPKLKRLREGVAERGRLLVFTVTSRMDARAGRSRKKSAQRSGLAGQRSVHGGRASAGMRDGLWGCVLQRVRAPTCDPHL